MNHLTDRLLHLAMFNSSAQVVNLQKKISSFIPFEFCLDLFANKSNSSRRIRDYSQSKKFGKILIEINSSPSISLLEYQYQIHPDGIEYHFNITTNSREEFSS